MPSPSTSLTTAPCDPVPTPQHLEDAGGGDVNEAVNQIAFADVILLNKIDLVTPEALQEARDLVRSINVTADLIEVQLAGSSGDGGGSDAAAAAAVARPSRCMLLGVMFDQVVAMPTDGLSKSAST